MSKSKDTRKETSGKSAPGAAASAIDLKLVRDLARLANEFDLEEIEVSPDGHVRIARGSARPEAAPPRALFPTHAPPMALVPPEPAEPRAPAADANAIIISSPFVGTFYRAASPDRDAFVEIGQTVRKGQVVCIVEAMKLMNEIEAEADGKLVEILVKNGQHVEYGQALFRLAKA